jgi:hypothetical protein
VAALERALRNIHSFNEKRQRPQNCRSISWAEPPTKRLEPPGRLSLTN